MIKEYLELGQIVGTHGIKGEIRINPWCDSPEFAKRFKVVYFDKTGSKSCKIVSQRPHGNIILMKLEGYNSIEESELLKNKMLYIKRADAKLDDGVWFIEELIGCEVFDHLSGKCYGKITDISQTGANDVWHITDSKNDEYLIPAIKDVIISVDVAAEKVVINPMRGIFDDED